MKIILGEKFFDRRQKLKEIILSFDAKAEILECEDWDCTLLDLIRSDQSELLFLDLNIMGVSWLQRIKDLLGSISRTKIVLMGETIDPSLLVHAFEAGIIGFIPYSDMTSPKMHHILGLLIHKGVYLPSLILEKKTSLPNETQKYRLPSGDNLTKRQIQVLQYLMQGLSNKQIAAQMGITEPTVKLHIHGLFHKLGAINRTQILIKARELGFI